MKNQLVILIILLSVFATGCKQTSVDISASESEEGLEVIEEDDSLPPPASPTPLKPPRKEPTSPTDPTPVNPTPVDPTPVDPTPVDPTPVDPVPVEPPPPTNPVPITPVDPPPPVTPSISGKKPRDVSIDDSYYIQPNNWPRMPWDEQHPHSYNWNNYVLQSVLLNDLNLEANTPTDIMSFCPNYINLEEEKKAFFWVGFISSIAEHESHWQPYSEKERSRDVSFSKSPKSSMGLTGLTIDLYTTQQCNIKDSDQLFDDKINLQCATKIMSRLIKEDNFIIGQSNDHWLGAARYWHFLRNNKKLKLIQYKTNQLSFCK